MLIICKLFPAQPPYVCTLESIEGTSATRSLCGTPCSVPGVPQSAKHATGCMHALAVGLPREQGLRACLSNLLVQLGDELLVLLRRRGHLLLQQCDGMLLAHARLPGRAPAPNNTHCQYWLALIGHPHLCAFAPMLSSDSCKPLSLFYIQKCNMRTAQETVAVKPPRQSA